MQKMDGIIATIVILSLCSSSALAAQLNYTPINPTFGGNPLNASFLQAVATDNNHFQGNSYKTQVAPESPTQQIADQITNEVLAGVASNIASQIYGQNAAQSGTFQVGSTTITFDRVNGNIDLDIINGSGTTSLVIPAP